MLFFYYIVHVTNDCRALFLLHHVTLCISAQARKCTRSTLGILVYKLDMHNFPYIAFCVSFMMQVFMR